MTDEKVKGVVSFQDTRPGVPKMVSIAWTGGDMVDEDGKVYHKAEVFTEIFQTEILDIPITDKELFDAAYNDALARHHAGTPKGDALRSGNYTTQMHYDHGTGWGELIVLTVIVLGAIALVANWWGVF